MGKFCDYIYQDSEPIYSEDGSVLVNGNYLVRCVPKDGVQLYKIISLYIDKKPQYPYYFLGRTTKEVRSEFNKLFDYFKITDIQVVPLDSSEAESVLTIKSKVWPFNMFSGCQEDDFPVATYTYDYKRFNEYTNLLD